MPVLTNVVALGTTATEIIGSDNMPQDVLIHNNSTGDAIVYLGEDDTVTSSTGTVLVAEERIAMELMPGDALFAIGSTADIDLRILQIQKN